MTSHRTGLLIIRAWVERGSSDPLRANIRISDDVSLGIERTIDVIRPDGVSRIVDAWVRDLLDAPPTDRAG